MTKLPQFIGSSVPEGAPSSGWTGASGATILNLRGVGANRTLVLLDGRRVVSSTRTGTFDVNLVPQALLKDVQVVTGGASAAYGSDAVSGVVNFILDTRFTGFKVGCPGRRDRPQRQPELPRLAGGRHRPSETSSTSLPRRTSIMLSRSATPSHAIGSTAGESSRTRSSGSRDSRNASPHPMPAPPSTQKADSSRVVRSPGPSSCRAEPQRRSSKARTSRPSAQSGGDGVDPLMYNYLTPRSAQGQRLRPHHLRSHRPCPAIPARAVRRQ